MVGTKINMNLICAMFRAWITFGVCGILFVLMAVG